MKCIHCDYDSKYKERSARTCPKCHQHFAFEPKEGDKFTDAAFAAAIDAVSAHGHVQWGVEHLYYEICRRYRRKTMSAKVRVACAAVLAIAGGLLLAGSLRGAALLAFAAAAAMMIGAIIRAFSYGVPLPLEKFDSMWQLWISAHGRPAVVIVRAAKPAPRLGEPDIADYSFDRAVICDRARTVDLLLANNFHFENNCAVLSLNGYPEGPFATVRTMLKRNPRLQVFALHDATVLGCKMAHKLAGDPEWFAGQGSVTDVGLRPAQTKKFAGLFLRGEQIASMEGLSGSEATWLRKYSLEMAAIRPEQVLKRLFRAINRHPEKEDKDSISTYAGDMDGGVDSFG